MGGKWERKSPAVWMYRLVGAARPYGYVGQYKGSGRVDADWDATVTATRLDDVAIAEGVSFDEARTALERYAQQHADPVDRARATERGADS